MDLAQQIVEVRSERRELERSRRMLEVKIEEIKNQAEVLKTAGEAELNMAREEYMETKRLEVHETYEDKLNSTKEEVEQLQSSLSHDDVEDDEELAKERERMEYLNSAAIFIQRYYDELQKVSTPYFIEVAYNEKFLNDKQFEKEFIALPRRTRELKDWSLRDVQPFKLVKKLSQSKSSTNFGVYGTATLGSLMVLVTSPMALVSSVRRAKALHKAAKRYHSLMHSLVSMKDQTHSKIQALFKSLIALRSQRLRELLDIKEKELEELKNRIQEDLDSIVFDETEFKKMQKAKLVANKLELEKAIDKQKELNEKFEEVDARYNALVAEQREQVLEELNLFMQGRETREVVLPTQLIYDHLSDYNTKYELKPGIYLYNSRADIEKLIQVSIFQLRNVMKWGSIQFRVLDLLGGVFVSPLMLPMTGKAKVQDIFVYGLSEEREDVIEAMHDLFLRRKTQVPQVASNIAEYNIIQENNGSAVLPYQMIFILLDQAVKLNEKLIQLIKMGNDFGLQIMVFQEQELMNLSLAKTIDSYFEWFLEVGEGGISSYLPESYVSRLEQQEADKNSRMR